jgi:GxxExxY protein
MMISLQQLGHECLQQQPIQVYYEGQVIGDYYADIIVDGVVIVELKAAQAIAYEHEIQLINYLKATKIEVGLLLNFGRKPEFVRKIYSNDRKPLRSGYKSASLYAFYPPHLV